MRTKSPCYARFQSRTARLYHSRGRRTPLTTPGLSQLLQTSLLRKTVRATLSSFRPSALTTSTTNQSTSLSTRVKLPTSTVSQSVRRSAIARAMSTLRPRREQHRHHTRYQAPLHRSTPSTVGYPILYSQASALSLAHQAKLTVPPIVLSIHLHCVYPHLGMRTCKQMGNPSLLGSQTQTPA